MSEAVVSEIAVYEPAYPQLFQSLRNAGWRPGLGAGGHEDDICWPVEADLFYANDFSLYMFSELHMKSIGSAPREIRFYPGDVFKQMSTQEDYSSNIKSILGEDASPVAEFGSYVLFVNEDRRAGAMSSRLDRLV